MLEAFSIFHVSGPVLWSRGTSSATERAINALINDVFIEEKVRTSFFQHDKLTLKWTKVAEFGLCFVAVYQSLLHLSWVDKFLEDIKAVFITTNRSQLEKSDWIGKYDFGAYYDKILQRYVEDGQVKTKTEEVNSQEEGDTGGPPPPSLLKPTGFVGDSDATPVQSPDVSRPTTPLPGAAHLLAENRPASRGSRRARKAANAVNNPTRSGTNSAYVSSGDERPKTPKSGGKKARKWDSDGIAVEEDDTVLDYSNLGDSPAQGTAMDSIDETTWGTRNKKGQFVLKDLGDEIDNILKDTKDAKPQSTTEEASSGAFGKISGYFTSIIGGKTLTEADLEQPLRSMEEHLIKKNVAREAAIRLCAGIKSEMVGKKTATFESVEKSLRPALESSLRKLLTPRTSDDLLNEIQSVKGRPYVISVVGVNGVGKSTNLSKICYFLLQNNYKVLVVAGDTFRAGAVEQLGVHVRNLKELSAREKAGKVDLFQKGYGKDAANIAKDAVTYAGQNDFNVVLIDTAGRAHNNQQLMSALEKFGEFANPDKIFQVAEALVGNDSVNQARNFNKAFGKRSLSGFIISKCDTVGDQVGTIVSMVASTGIPVVFLGVGQHYGDIRQMSVGWVVDKLMS